MDKLFQQWKLINNPLQKNKDSAVASKLETNQNPTTIPKKVIYVIKIKTFKIKSETFRQLQT